MNKVTLLKNRLNEIADSLKCHPNGLGLLGLGSAGKEFNRMDEYSDLDFFAIVGEGHKQQFIDNLSWLAHIHEIAWCFKNTTDGYKLLFADGIFCEFAVFEPKELRHIPYSQGHFIWRDEGLAEHNCKPVIAAPQHSFDEGFLLGELLTNLYVGLCRYRRGEQCSAMRFIQVYAVDRLIRLLDLLQQHDEGIDKDKFCLDRRVEQRQPEFKQLLMQCSQGAEKCTESAHAMLQFVKQHYSIDKILEQEIRQLIY
ncbi:hypothetical protein RI844_13195 [Thalassotalea fonticola]|uniref:Nucleotidyltransferase domain-containing protein n=1 Tax=Thalassotalea fonticola TaxID=3065649 RepID=A0ABZ0GLD4_9GAMM|nr:hypothetical protein RI844_13195 [Colwelliaceae bacterium S1-1]